MCRVPYPRNDSAPTSITAHKNCVRCWLNCLAYYADKTQKRQLATACSCETKDFVESRNSYSQAAWDNSNHANHVLLRGGIFNRTCGTHENLYS